MIKIDVLSMEGKLILVTSTGHPLESYFNKVASEVSVVAGMRVEVRENDYIYLDKYGAKDEFGVTWLPQLLVQVEKEVFPLLTEPALNGKGELDVNAGVNEALRKLRRYQGRDD